MKQLKQEGNFLSVPEHAGLILCCDGVPVFKSSGTFNTIYKCDLQTCNQHAYNLLIASYRSNPLARSNVHHFPSPNDTNEFRKHDGRSTVAWPL